MGEGAHEGRPYTGHRPTLTSTPRDLTVALDSRFRGNDGGEGASSVSDPHSGVLDYPYLTLGGCACQCFKQARTDFQETLPCLVGQPENHDSRILLWRVRPDIGKIQVLSYQDAFLGETDRRNVRIRRASNPLVEHGHRVVPRLYE